MKKGRDLELLHPGDVVAGRFHIIEPIGAGVIGQVFTADDELSDRLAAVKVLRHRFLEMPRLEAYGSALPIAPILRREARLLKRLEHHGICQFLDAGEINGCPWLATEFVGRKFFADLRPPLQPQQALRLVAGLLEPLTYLHSMGFVHRDISPGNLGLRDDRSLVIIDFGLAQPMGRVGLATVERFMGTRLFSPPECHSTTAFETILMPSADVFSTARVLEWLVTGDGMRVSYDEPVTDLPEMLANIIHQATSISPEARPQSIRELLVACQLALG
ncbi:MAG: serine/threonine protein kinase [Actinobacteria bacterium]|nr:serine/threonine protein kinase [Actinomycetota bacterium]